MSIIETQLTKLIAETSLNSLKSGRILELNAISKIIAKKIRELNGGPTLTFRPQYKKDKFNYTAYNEMMSEIKFDIEVLYDIIIEKVDSILQSYSSVDISYRSQKSQVNLIKGILDDLLFSTRNADDYFFGVFDTFNSTNKIDLNSTTQGCVDLSEGAIVLPYNTPSAERVPLDHLYNTINGNVSVKSLTNKSVSSKNGVPTTFGYAFSDTSSIWRYEVLSEDNNGVELTITFPLSPSAEITRITRVETSIIGSNNIVVRLLSSIDNQNFTRPPGTTDKTVHDDTAKVAWDFDDIGVRYIRLVLTKTTPDTQLSNSQTLSSPVVSNQSTNISQSNSFGITTQSWLYNFNISSIACYKLGRSIDAIFITKPLNPNDKVSPVQSISLETEEDIQPKTNIDYYVALCDSKGAETSNYIQINPTNRIDNDLPKVIKYNELNKDSISFTGSYTNNSNVVTYNRNNFYPILSLTSGQTYQFGTSKLYRGFNLFSRTTNTSDSIRSVSDNFIDFSDGSRVKQLYSVVSETVSVINRNVLNGSVVKTFLRTANPIVRSIRNIPDTTIDPDPSIDTDPDYSIYKIQHVRPSMFIDGQRIRPTGIPIIVQGISIPVASSWTGTASNSSSIGVPILLNGQPIEIINTGVGKPVLKYVSQNLTYTFREGIDYTIKRSDDPYFNTFGWGSNIPIHWRIVPSEPVQVVVNSGSPLTGQYGSTGVFTYTGSSLPPITLGSNTLTSTQELQISYYINPDITSKVVSVSYQSSEIELDGLIEIGPGDSIIVDYKSLPSRIIKQSIKVTSNPGRQNEGTIFQEGIDYIIDLNSSTINRVAGGSLYSTQSVYVDFSYKVATSDTQSYSIWCYVEVKDPVKFDYNPLTIKRGSGESITWSYFGANKVVPRELSDLTSITLSRGWHFFTVKSLDPAIFNDSAINKFIKLRSVAGDYMFLKKRYGGTIFSTMTGLREPLREVPFAFLKASTLASDHSTFSIDNYNVYVNFPIGNSAELWPYELDSSGNITRISSEELLFEGYKKVRTIADNNPGYVKLKARLNREQNTSGGSTPKLLSYNLRLSY